MHQHTVIGIGELLWDCFGDEMRPGGAPANVAFHANQLGMSGLVVSRVGRDAAGDKLVSELAARGLSTDAIHRDDRHPTGRVTVDFSIPDRPAYTIHEDVAWDHIEFNPAMSDACRRASAVCFGTLAQRCPASRTAIRRLIEACADALLVFDVNLRPPWFAADVIDDSLNRCHVAKLNDEEVRIVAELLEVAGSTAEDRGRALLERFALRALCITRGANGCLILSQDDRVEVPGRPVTIVDAVGAGDAFTAALVCGLLWKWPLADAARLANDVGALVAGQRGAMPDLRSEYAALTGGSGL